MQPEQENFDALQRLLKLKRYEQPPPRYFNEFSANVIAGIRAVGTANGRAAEQLEWEAPWLHRLLGALQAKPVYGWVFACALCVLVVGGIVSLERPDTLPNVAIGGGGESFTSVDKPELSPFVVFGGQAAAHAERLANLGSTNPVIPFEGPLFNGQPSTQPVPVSGPFGPLR
jgi:hypothetical protein